MIVIEAASAGVPSIVAEDRDNAATELVEEGVNGFIARSAAPEDLSAAIIRAIEGGLPLRQSTADWFRRNARRLSLGHALESVLESYAGDSSARR